MFSVAYSCSSVLNRARYAGEEKAIRRKQDTGELSLLSTSEQILKAGMILAFY